MKKISTVFSLLLMLCIATANAATFNVTLKVSGNSGDNAYQDIILLKGDHPLSSPIDASKAIQLTSNEYNFTVTTSGSTAQWYYIYPNTNATVTSVTSSISTDYGVTVSDDNGWAGQPLHYDVKFMNRGTATFDVVLEVNVTSEGGSGEEPAEEGITFNISGAGGDRAYLNLDIFNEWLYAGMEPADYALELTKNTYVYDGDKKEFYIWAKEGYQVTVTSPTEGVGNPSVEACPNGSIKLNKGYFFGGMPDQDVYEIQMKTDVPAVFNIEVTSLGGQEQQGPEVNVVFNVYDKDLSNDDVDVPVDGAVSNVSFLGNDIALDGNTATIYLGENYTPQNLTALISKAGYYVADVNATYKAGFMNASTKASISENGELSVEIPALDSGKTVEVHIGLTKNNPSAPQEFTATVAYEGLDEAYKYVTYSTSADGAYSTPNADTQTFTFAPEEALEVNFKAVDGYEINAISAVSSEEECIILNEAAGETAQPDVNYTGSIKEADGVYTLSLDGNVVNNGVSVTINLAEKVRTITFNISGEGDGAAFQNVDIFTEWLFAGMEPADYALELSRNTVTYTEDSNTFYIWAKEGYEVSVSSPTEGVGNPSVEACPNGTIKLNEGYFFGGMPDQNIYEIEMKSNVDAVFDIVVSAVEESKGPEITVVFNVYDKDLSTEDEEVAIEGAVSNVSFLGESVELDGNTAVIYLGNDYVSEQPLTATIALEGYLVDPESVNATYSMGMMAGNAVASVTEEGLLTVKIPVVDTDKTVTVNIGMFNEEYSGINSVEADKADADVIYNLNGMRVGKSNLTKGVYIINGKKVIVK